MPKKKRARKAPPPDTQRRMDDVLKAIFGADGSSPVRIDLSDSLQRGKKFQVSLTENQRKSLVELCNLPKRLNKKLESAGTGKQVLAMTRTELDELHDRIGEASIHAPVAHRKRLQSVQTQVVELFADDTHEGLVRHTTKQARAKKPTTTIYQFKLTLLGIKPKIWRRIQIPDYKLHNLHLHIQAAMGWDNKHLHHFDIKGERHGIPEHLDYDGDGSIIDSKKIKVSDIVPKDGKKISLRYT